MTLRREANEWRSMLDGPIETGTGVAYMLSREDE
jgi:hypothetical protein